MKKLIGTIAVFVIASAAAYGSCKDVTAFGEPKGADRVMCKANTFVVSYSYGLKQPTWTGEYLTKEGVTKRDSRGKFRFQEDKEVPPYARATLDDYRGSGFDRFHLVPFASVDDSRDPRPARASFLLSNVAPGEAKLNREGWAELEGYVRYAAKKHGSVIVFTGPIFTQDRGTIGRGKVKVPSHFYKVVYAPKAKRMWAYVMPNEKVSRQRVHQYATTVDDVEQATGLDFFSGLPRALQIRLEKRKDFLR